VILNLLWNGIIIAYWSTLLVPIMTDIQQPEDCNGDETCDNNKTSKALYGMVGFGFGEVFGGLLHGLLIDKIGSRKTIFINILIVILVISATQYNISLTEFGAWSFIMCFLWGYEDGSCNIFLFQLLGNQFDAKHSGEAFGCFNLMQGLAVFTMQLIQG